MSGRVMRIGLVALMMVYAWGSGGGRAQAQEASPSLLAGAAKHSIVPPFPTHMGGYFDRTQTFTGVASPIYTRALVMDDGRTRLAVVTTDLIAVSRALVDLVRTRVAAESGLGAENVLVCAAHNHSGPSGFKADSLFNQPEDEGLTAFLVSTMAEVVQEACAAMVPARLSFGTGQLETITRNRQQSNDEAVDPDVGVLAIQKAENRDVLAVMFNFTGHPVILGSDNLHISGEYPGQAAETVESVLGGIALFTQGACGDVTMKRSGPPLEEVKRLGRILGAEVIKTAMLAEPSKDVRLASHFEEVEVEPRHLPTAAEAEKQLEAARAAVESAGDVPPATLERLKRDAAAAQTTLATARSAEEHPEYFKAACHASVHVMQTGPVILVGIPGELFVEYGLEMKQRVRQDLDRPMFLVGYANGYNGYIVTPRAAATGGYEQAIARVAPSAGRTLTEAAMSIARETVPRR